MYFYFFHLQVERLLQQCLVFLPPGLTASLRSPRLLMRSLLKHPEEPLNSQCRFLKIWPVMLTKILFYNDFTHWCLCRSLLLSDDEEDTKRVVRSAKDKRFVLHHFILKSTVYCVINSCLFFRFEELTNLIKTIRNAMKIRDMSKCLEEFEQLCRAFLKSKNIVDKEGVPSFYIRLLADLEDYLNQVGCRA